MERPTKNEYNPRYQAYIDLVENGDFLELLDENTQSTISFFQSIDVSKHNFSYAEKKWTIKEILMHIIDTERGLSFRAIVCTRNDKSIPLYGMEEDFYAQNVDVTNITMDNLIKEFIAVREAFKFIYVNNPIEKFNFLGDGISHPISARAIGYIVIGHTIHHQMIMNERYLS